MDEDDRRKLYSTLLTGIANECQDRLCAADQQHAWGPWVRYQIQHDLDDIPVRFDAEPVTDRMVRIGAERRCLNCGKEQTDPA